MEFKINLPTLKVTDEQLLKDLKDVAKKLKKRTLSMNDYKEYGKYSYTSFRNHFGTWKKALEKVGLSRSRNWGTNREEFLENIKEVWLKLGRQPKYSEMVIPFSTYNSTAYAHFFENWTNALVEFEKYLDEEKIDTISSIEAKPVIAKKSHKTQRTINWRLRFKVMQRDNFKCQFCGRSPAKNSEIELHVDHIKPWSKGGETVYENLQTLCSKCNLGKSDLE
jgi:hypothetical protein